MATAFADVDPAETENTVAETATDHVASAGEASGAASSAAAGKVQEVVSKFGKGLIAPALGIVCFLSLWAVLAPQVDTPPGALPGPLALPELGHASRTGR